MSNDEYDCDVLIVGSGIVGATYAKRFRTASDNEPKFKVWMVEVGSQEARDIAAHKKNNVIYQKDIDQFVHIIQSSLSPVSVPSSHYIPEGSNVPGHNVHAKHNPHQDPDKNLPGQAVTRTVGGMSTHWTCSIPRFAPEELPDLVGVTEENRALWDNLYSEIEKNYLPPRTDQFKDSVRQQKLKDIILKDDGITELRLGCVRDQKSGFVTWSSARTVFDFQEDENFKLYTSTICTRLECDAQQRVVGAWVKDMQSSDPERKIKARYYVVAAGAIATPQILYNSHLQDNGTKFPKLDNLGLWIAEQPLAFCQVVMFKRFREGITPDDPEPQLMIPFKIDKEKNINRPWHCQVHRDAFSYGMIPDSVKREHIVDFRWFGRPTLSKDRRLFFDPVDKDVFGMPQPTFDYVVSEDDSTEVQQEHNRMMVHMTEIACKVGKFLPGAAPQFMPPGLALHLGGSHRLGLTKTDSVVNTYSQVWDIDNLYLGGVGNLNTAFAANPTFTAMALAYRSATHILEGHPKAE